jgi:anti-sigma-K factor RskA
MNTRPHPPADDAQGRFDQALRARHAEAVARISPRVRAQLAQRRHAALRGDAVAAPGWGLRHLAVGTAFVAVLALGIALLPDTPDASAPAADAAIASATSAPAPNTILDEDPEFYAWLASTDGQLLAME